MASVRKRTWTHKGVQKTAWIVDYTDQNGNRRQKTFEKKKDADYQRTKITSEIQRGEHIPDSATITVSEALDLWLQNCDARVAIKDRIRPATVMNFRSWAKNHIQPTLGPKLLTQLTFHVVQKWIDDLAMDRAKPRSHKTITNVLVCLSLMLKHAYTRGYVARNIMREHQFRVPGKPSGRIAVPEKAEVKRLLDCARGSQGPGGVAAYLRPMLMTATFSGLRQGELRALLWANVDFDKRLIKVRHSADILGRINDPKTEAGLRDVPMSPQLVQELRLWKVAQRPNKAGLVFTTRSGAPIRQGSIHQSWSRLQHRAENDGKGTTTLPKSKYHFHALRHVCASLLIEAGLPPKRVQTIMGHTSVQMTFDLYGHLFEDSALVDAAMDKIGAGIVA